MSLIFPTVKYKNREGFLQDFVKATVAFGIFSLCCRKTLDSVSTLIKIDYKFEKLAAFNHTELSRFGN
ncbi:hypothetical protein ACF3DV_14050 [Chlorogloeopsis fritschii PCC 9212]|uniref:Uncharacterized protein n=1 Tax=Chlorogloeopsis fritschii PCC 6912 TaxID=211165 RepID=A0A433NRB8_CHLFR|nr:hypothetical protein [Chlorogloeopsis fritschii]RUR86716.1 hypothetical protein PCC6912_01590 [Chlorogloeopsis fritschii PCC 6912]